MFVGHNWVRRQVMGMADRAPRADELDQMRELVRQGMDEGAYGLSSGLFYLPGNYAETEEVIELNRVAAQYPGAIYDTHDRDLGAAYPPFGYLKSIAEGIRIGEEAGTKVIFSHFNAQGAHNYGRAPEGAALIEAARARGVEVAGAHHSYTATQSNLRSYTVPGWAVDGGDSAMVRRFDDPDTLALLDAQTREMLAIRGGADRLLFADPRPELNGKTLRQVADGWGTDAPEAARRILREGNAAVMNLGLYDIENVALLGPARMDYDVHRRPGPGAGAPRHPPPRIRLLHQEDSRPCAGRSADHAAPLDPLDDGLGRRLPGLDRPGATCVRATPPTSRCWTWPRSRTWPPTRTLTSTLAGPCTSWSTACSRSGTEKPRRRWQAAPWCVAAASSEPNPGNTPRAADGPLPGGVRRTICPC